MLNRVKSLRFMYTGHALFPHQVRVVQSVRRQPPLFPVPPVRKVSEDEPEAQEETDLRRPQQDK